MIRKFQDLKVWVKSHELVLEIYKITKTFPEEERFGLISQVRRSASSISANICEGYKKSRKDFLRFIDIAQGSLEETKYHIILSKDLGYLESQDFTRLFSLSEEIGLMLNSLSQKLKF